MPPLPHPPCPDGHPLRFPIVPELGDIDGAALIGTLLDRIPEFLPAYLELAEGTGNDPGETTVLMVLAEFVSSQLRRYERVGRILSHALAIVEDHLASLGDDEVGTELVGYAFFDSLEPEERRLLTPWTGPLGREQVAQLDDVVPAWGE